MKKTILFFTALSLSTAVLGQQEQNVNIYTYDSFTSDWGAGPKIKQGFEQKYPLCQSELYAF